MSVTINRDEWLKALTEAHIHVENEPDAVSVTEFAEMMGLKRSSAGRRLDDLVALGRARETHKWITMNQRRHYVKAYVLVTL